MRRLRCEGMGELNCEVMHCFELTNGLFVSLLLSAYSSSLSA